MKSRRSRRWQERHVPVTLDLTMLDVMADLDPGWVERRVRDDLRALQQREGGTNAGCAARTRGAA